MFIARRMIIVITVILSASSLTQARMLHHKTGRFLQRDPLKYADGMNLYQYVGSSPTIAIDPFGLFKFKRCPPIKRAPIQEPTWVRPRPGVRPIRYPIPPELPASASVATKVCTGGATVGIVKRVCVYLSYALLLPLSDTYIPQPVISTVNNYDEDDCDEANDVCLIYCYIYYDRPSIDYDRCIDGCDFMQFMCEENLRKGLPWPRDKRHPGWPEWPPFR